MCPFHDFHGDKGLHLLGSFCDHVVFLRELLYQEVTNANP